MNANNIVLVYLFVTFQQSSRFAGAATATLEKLTHLFPMHPFSSPWKH